VHPRRAIIDSLLSALSALKQYNRPVSNHSRIPCIPVLSYHMGGIWIPLQSCHHKTSYVKMFTETTSTCEAIHALNLESTYYMRGMQVVAEPGVYWTISRLQRQA
jgi:hypothetical protein